MSEVYNDLKDIRKLKRRGLQSNLTNKYIKLFERLSPLQNTVMTECYIGGLSYADCGHKIYYCERQIKRIVKRSIERLTELERGS